MSFIAAALIGGGAAIVGGMMASDAAGDAADAAGDAADAQVQATDQSIQAQLEMYYQSREDLLPWLEAGGDALNLLVEKINSGAGTFNPEEEPGYEFGYKEFVEKPLLRGASASGSLASGSNLKDLTRYASDYATTKYDDFLNRWYQSLTPLQSLAGVGQTTAAQQGQNALVTGELIGENMLAAGDARASGYINQGNVWSNAASDMGQNIMDMYYINKYLT